MRNFTEIYFAEDFEMDLQTLVDKYIDMGIDKKTLIDTLEKMSAYAEDQNIVWRDISE